jgi:putative transposase
MYITLKLRLSDTHSSELKRQAAAVNFVWNYLNETQKKAAQSLRPWLTKYTLMKLTSGASKELGLNSQSICRICHTYCDSRAAKRKPWLRWRGKKSLGWVPFKAGNVRFDGSVFIFNGKRYRPLHLHKNLVPGMRFAAGAFNADGKGNWYINVPTKIEPEEKDYAGAVGIDLGLKTLATLSTGDKIEMPSFYRENEKTLATAQRARKSKRSRSIQAKARNRRKDFLHKASNTVVREFRTIIVGDAAPKSMVKTRMAKSIHDAAWASFKNMLSYKAMMHGGRFVEASETYSTQICSECGSLPASRPRGIADLRIREWCCDECGTIHDRDVNAARNILRVGLDALVEARKVIEPFIQAPHQVSEGFVVVTNGQLRAVADWAAKHGGQDG